ncbi:unnamed protein product [Cercopithifilaria johnstoni]|uniref:Uncharacterized protein n=1 Tax=Cercopithifilaria johnstoni TaxID=2874296 RepID=A0A8J2LZN2_9BILA|nr:unnamed protein product [Cercopithifilaria johnstoni]
MVWRNDNDHVRRRLPTIPSESEIFPTLAKLNLEEKDDRVEELLLSQRLRQFWSPTIIRLTTFPVHYIQWREFLSKEGMKRCKKLSKNSI